MVRYETPVRHDQRPFHRSEFGPNLVCVDEGGGGRYRGGDRREPGIARASEPRPVDQVRCRTEHNRRRTGGPSLHQVEQLAAGAFGVRAGVPGDDQRDTPAAERESGAHGGVQTMRVDHVRRQAGGTQRGDGRGIAAPRYGVNRTPVPEKS